MDNDTKGIEDGEAAAQAKLEAEDGKKREAASHMGESLIDLEMSLAKHGLSVASVIREHVKRTHGITL